MPFPSANLFEPVASRVQWNSRRAGIEIICAGVTGFDTTVRNLMELTYKVRSSDGGEYGPATLEQLTGWIREGRVLPQQQIQRNDMEHWAAAGEFTELKGAFGPSLPPTLPASSPRMTGAGATRMDAGAMGSLRSSASWFYWVAGLSLVNTVLALTGVGIRFIFGLGVTQIFDAFGAGFAGAGTLVALVLDLLAAGVLVLFGVFANKGQTWAFIVGMALLALDGLLLLLVRDWLGVAFHAYVLFRLFQGFQISRQLRAA